MYRKYRLGRHSTQKAPSWSGRVLPLALAISHIAPVAPTDAVQVAVVQGSCCYVLLSLQRQAATCCQVLRWTIPGSSALVKPWTTIIAAMAMMGLLWCWRRASRRCRSTVAHSFAMRQRHRPFPSHNTTRKNISRGGARSALLGDSCRVKNIDSGDLRHFIVSFSWPRIARRGEDLANSVGRPSCGTPILASACFPSWSRA